MRISSMEIAEFLRSDRSVGVYGMGYFCHNSYGDVLLVANTNVYHKQSYHDYVREFGPYNEDNYKWHIGNWKHPAGIGEGPGLQSDQYSLGWKPFRKAIEDAMGNDYEPGLALRVFCIETLKQLISDGVFDREARGMGFTVMDVDDPEERGYLTKLKFDHYLMQCKRRT